MPCNAGAQNWKSQRESQECNSDNVAADVVCPGNHYDMTMRCQSSRENSEEVSPVPITQTKSQECDVNASLGCPGVRQHVCPSNNTSRRC